MSDVVHIHPRRTEEADSICADTPAVGRWYWVDSTDKDKERRLACVTHLGSNYIKVTYADNSNTQRIHHDHFWSRCEFVEDPNAILQGNAERCKRELSGLMEDVKQLTSKLGVAPSLSLGAGETAATSLALSSSAPAHEYKAALVKAKEETLPEIFEAIKEKSAEYGQWLAAQVIPMKAEAKKLEPAIERIEDRIFSVQLYAGLCEEVELIKDGAPAELTDPIHLFQRRLYMDEECLANYDTGGMEFRDLRAFERWLCRKDNLSRILPFPRTVVAFQVRHQKKEREVVNLSDFVRFLNASQLDKLTFLYIRNGARVYRLSTEINFGEKLFPDADHPVLSPGEGRLFTRGEGKDFKVVGEAEYNVMVDSDEAEDREYERRVKEEKKKPKNEREYISSPSYFSKQARDFEPFTKDNVNYDDILQQITKQMNQHNRVVLVLQGLLDRSPALHPHPQWRLHDAGGFAQALRLHRDADRVLSPGDKPDFEAYRARLNASIGVGTVTVGQEEAWERFEAKKENSRRNRDYRFRQSEYRPERYRPEGDPGPGRFARVVRLDRKGHVHYRWQKDRRRGQQGPPVARKYGCKASRILNVDAYQPGDYKRFYTDPRTREEYLQWAPLLLAAEEYKAGRHGVVPQIAKPPPKAPRPAPTGASGRLRMLRGWLGKAVRLTRPVTTRGGTKYEKNTLWRVSHLERGEFSILGIDVDGKTDGRMVRCVSHFGFYLEPAVPSDPKYEFKREKREKVPTVDEEDDQ